MSVNEVLTKTYFADGRMKVPMVSSLVSMTVNITVVVLFSSKLGVGGIALISGIATAINCTINYLVMRKGERLLSGRDWLDILKSLICAAVMGALVYLIQSRFTGLSNIVCVAVCAAAGFAAYMILALILRSDEIRFFKTTLLKRCAK